MAIISVPSYVVPGTYLENIGFLREKDSVDAVELLFFSFDEDAERLLQDELSGIASAKDRFSFSAHMPDVLDDRCERLVEMLTGIVDRFVVHVPPGGLEAFANRLFRWRGRFGDVFAVENVPGRPFREAALRLSDIPLCLDTGHLLLDGESPADSLVRWGGRTAEVHLHGTANGKDHAPIAGNEEWFLACVPFFDRFAGTIHIELFDYDAIVPMLDIVDGFRNTGSGGGRGNDGVGNSGSGNGRTDGFGIGQEGRGKQGRKR